MSTKIRAIISELLQVRKPEDEIRIGERLRNYILELQENDLQELDETQDQWLGSGLALAPRYASACLKDYHRTVRFIQGVQQAIQDQLKQKEDEVIRILYAGCGPHAVQLLPILHLFPKERLEIHLLDFHQYSIQAVQKLVSMLDLEVYHISYHSGDAAEFSHPEQQKFDLILCETMFEALFREPQMALSLHLMPQLSESGIFIPEQIQIDVVQTNYRSLPRIKEDMELENKNQQRQHPIPLGEALILNKDFVNSFNPSKTRQLLTSHFQYQLSQQNSHREVVLLTKVKIYQEFQLDDGESLISNPKILGTLESCAPSGKFWLSYVWDQQPKWLISSRPLSSST
ncbi:MAG: class I SAM-dependent methyltransferase [Bacteroidetes bacterium]|nr:MAG: class I SAM-dependent methyltransferase [Bacteroidota bacterium]